MLALYFLFSAKHKSIALIIFTFFVIAVNAHLSMLAETKTGRVVPIIAVAIYLAYCFYQYKTKWLCAGLLLTCVAASFTPKAWFDVRPGQAADAPIGIQSLGIRPMLYEIGVDMMLDEPLYGYGEQLSYEFKKRRANYEKAHNIESLGDFTTSHVHNDPLQWTLLLGVISGLAFVGVFLTWCVGLYKGWLEPSILLLALPFVGHSLLEYPFNHSAPHLLVLSLILGLAIRRRGKPIHIPQKLGGVAFIISGFLSYQTIAFMLLSISASSVLVSYRLGGQTDEALLYTVEPTSPFNLYFTHEKYQWQFKKAIQAGSVSQQLTYDFIDFLENYRIKVPQSILYVQLAELYMISGQQNKANAIMQEARLFFPTEPKVIAYFQASQ
jgi:O-antigen polymerase